jgi:hypothetical protein
VPEDGEFDLIVELSGVAAQSNNAAEQQIGESEEHRPDLL